MASTKLAFGSILTTVSTTANTITASIGAVGVGADMLTAFVNKQSNEQAYQYKLEAKAFKQNCRAEIALQLANSAEQVAKQKAKSQTFSDSFDHFFALLDEDTE